MIKDDIKNPKLDFGNMAFWSLNDKIEKMEMARQIKEMGKCGWGGFFLHARVGLSVEYLSNEWFEMINFAIDEAEKNGIKGWLYDEDTYPSGFAGGLLYKNEEFRSRCLALVEMDKLTKCDKILKEYNNNGIKYAICDRVMDVGVPNFNGGCYIDLMNPKATKAFFDLTLEGYKKHCGDKFGKEIQGIFTDEPNYLMFYFQTTPVAPWSNYLRDFFSELKGYDILEHVEKIFFDVGNYKKIRYDLYESALKLFIKSYTKPYYEWCEENKIALTGHVMGEDYFEYQIQWIGAAMPHYEYMQMPGIDKLGRHTDNLTTVKQCTSVAEQLGRKRVLSESYGCIGQHSSFGERRWLANWQANLGINFFCSHLSQYTMRGDRKRDYPANLFYQQPWWDMEKGFADYTARLSYISAFGKPEIDTLVLHTIESGWCVHNPALKRSGEPYYTPSPTQYYSESLDQVALKLKQNNVDFHFGDEIIMEGNAKVVNGLLCIGQYAYETLIIPPSITIKRNTLKLLLLTTKTQLIFIGGYPQLVEGEPTEVAIPGAILTTKIDDAIAIISAKTKVKTIDKNTGGNAKEIFVTKRVDENTAFYHFTNTALTREKPLKITIDSDKYLYFIDLGNGKIYKGSNKFQATIYGGGSLIVYETNEEISCSETQNYLESGVMFRENQREIQRISNMKVTLMEDNVMPINNATVAINGAVVCVDSPLSTVWHNYFYPAKNGTPFWAKYYFTIDEMPNGPLFFAIENAENLDLIRVNGKKIVPLKKPGDPNYLDENVVYKDISFTKVWCGDNLVVGENVLEIQGVKMSNISGLGTHCKTQNYDGCRFTEVEPVYIVGNFSVSNLDNEKFSIGVKNEFSKNITESGGCFYAGKAKFETTCGKISGKVQLKVNNVSAAAVALYVNGEIVGIRYAQPYIFDVALTNDVNKIEIQAATTLFNLMGPNNYDGVMDLLYVGPMHFVDNEMYTKKYKLLPFGIGDITLI